jgi:hypothetical protein
MRDVADRDVDGHAVLDERACLIESGFIGKHHAF